MKRRYLPPSVIGVLTALLGLAACSGGAADSEPLVGGDTCTALTDGTWTFTGDAWGMGDTPMDGDLTMSTADCSFSFDNWSMAMDNLPTGGVIDGDAVQLDGLAAKWRTCTGTATDENNVSGTCTDDDTAFVLTFSG